MRDRIFGRDGIAHVALQETRSVKRGKPLIYETPQELIDVCLQCTKKSCNGNCSRYKSKKQSVDIKKDL